MWYEVSMSPLHKSTARAIQKNIERITLYLGYAETGSARKEFLLKKAKKAKKNSISALLHSLIVEKYPDFPKTGQ